MQGAVKHEGSFRSFLKKNPGQKVSLSDINKVLSSSKASPKRKKQAILAKTFAKFRKGKKKK